MAIETWQPIMSVHPVFTDDDPQPEHMPRPVGGRVNVRLLVTDEGGSIAGLDAGNVTVELSERLIKMLIADHAAEVKRVLASTPSTEEER